MSYWNRVADLKKEPLFARKEDAAKFGEAMKWEPELVGQRIGWLLDGNYGQEEMEHAKRVLGMRANANKAAQLNMMIAVIEWHCPNDLAVKEWKKLTAGEKHALDVAIKKAIREYLANEAL